MLKLFAALAGAWLALTATAGAETATAYNSSGAAYNWSGYYIGLNAGWGWRSKFEFPGSSYYSGIGVTSLDPAPPQSKHDGFTFGAGFGYNRQNGWFVWGLDYEFQYGDLGRAPNTTGRYFVTQGTSTGLVFNPRTGTYTPVTFTGAVANTALNFDSTDGDSNKWYGIIRARAGVAVDRALFFVSGGAAYRFSYDYTDPYVTNTNGTVTYYSGYNNFHNWGWVLGGGIEYAITNNLTFKLDYLHLDFGTATYVDAIASTALGTPVISSTRRTDDLVRFGINLNITIPALSAMGSYGESSGYGAPAAAKPAAKPAY